MLQPVPAITRCDPVNDTSCYTKTLHDLTASKSFTKKIFSGSGRLFVYFGKVAANSPPMSIMHHLVRMVLRSGFPRQVIGINASKMAVTAGVGSVVIPSRGIPVDNSAHLPRDNYALAIKANSSISGTIGAKGPSKTVATLVWYNLLKQKVLGGLPVIPASGWIVMSHPSNPVFVAPSPCFNGKSASLNRANFHHIRPQEKTEHMLCPIDEVVNLSWRLSCQ